MAPLNPEHLFQQALKLTESDAGRPRQADLRRAVSSAYYGLFHAVATAASDRFIGASNRSTARYELVYRSIDHSRLRILCDEVTKQTADSRFVPSGGFGTNLKAFATAIIDLYQMRHDADYNPSIDDKVGSPVARCHGARRLRGLCIGTHRRARGFPDPAALQAAQKLSVAD